MDPTSPLGMLAAAVAAAGADAPAPEPEEIYLWPELLQAWDFFWSLGPLWHYDAMGTRTGLDRAGLQAHLDELGPERGSPERLELWQLLCAAEREALTTWAELREQQRLREQAAAR